MKPQQPWAALVLLYYVAITLWCAWCASDCWNRKYRSIALVWTVDALVCAACAGFAHSIHLF